MPSFDVVSEVDQHELVNAVDQTNRDIEKRFDFKGTKARVELKEREITVIGGSEFQLDQIMEILRIKIAKRGIDTGCLEVGEQATTGKEMRLPVTARHGLDKETGKKIIKLIKDSKAKVQANIQEDQVRVTGKKRDDLQGCIALLKAADLPVPVQFTNFRD